MGFLPTLSRRPSLLRQPSLPLLGELDDESQAQAISFPLSITPPQPGRSRAHSNASISSFHLPTSMQLSHQNTPSISPAPFIWRHIRKPNSSSVSTFPSFSFGNSPGGLRTRPHSQLPGHGPFHHLAYRHHHPPPATSQKIPHTLSRSSSALSLSLSTNNRNAVYIDEMIDIDSGVDDHVAESGERLRSVDLGVVKSGDEDDELLLPWNEEGDPTTPHIPSSSPTINTPNPGGVNFNALRSSQIYLGIGTNTKTPIRPPPAPLLIIDSDDKGGLGGVGVIDEDAIEEIDHQFLTAGDRSANGSVYSHQHRQGEDDRSLMSQSRWSLTSSTDGISTPAGSSAFGVGGGGGGGGLFGSKKRMSLVGDKFDKAKAADNGKEKDEEEKEKEFVLFEENEKEKSRDKKRGRLVSFISRISSSMIAPPPPATFQNVTRLSPF